MTRVEGQTEASWSAGSDPAAGDLYPGLPLVSVIVVNYNYGRYLDRAIRSVVAQSYRDIECLVVDNASTDNSGAVLDAAQAEHPALRVVRRATNDGQTAACLDGLAQTHGPYVIFLDADDYLLPDAVATHIAVHLSSRVHVGFTSGDMLQVVDDRMVLSTNEGAATFITGGKTVRRDLLRPPAKAMGSELSREVERLAERVHLVPREQKAWVWAPTSGNCFRRDALDLFCDGDALVQLVSQTDLYLALGINAVSGSILVDEPVFAYRLHGANVFSSRPQLQGVLSFDAKRGAGQATKARHLLVEQMVTRVERFAQHPDMGWSFLHALRGLDSVPPVSMPAMAPVPLATYTPRQVRSAIARRVLASRGMLECVTFSFVARDRAALFGDTPDSMRLVNPIAADLDQMRPTPLATLAPAAARNVARGLPAGAMFEIGPAFTATSQQGFGGGTALRRAGPKLASRATTDRSEREGGRAGTACGTRLADGKPQRRSRGTRPLSSGPLWNGTSGTEARARVFR